MRKGDKTKAIEDVVNGNPGIQAQDVVELLRSRGIEVSKPMVYYVMQGRKSIMRNEVVYDDLKEAKMIMTDIGSAAKMKRAFEFAKKVGIDKAIQAVNSLEELARIQ